MGPLSPVRFQPAARPCSSCQLKRTWSLQKRRRTGLLWALLLALALDYGFGHAVRARGFQTRQSPGNGKQGSPLVRATAPPAACNGRLPSWRFSSVHLNVRTAFHQGDRPSLICPRRISSALPRSDALGQSFPTATSGMDAVNASPPNRFASSTNAARELFAQAACSDSPPAWQRYTHRTHGRLPCVHGDHPPLPFTYAVLHRRRFRTWKTAASTPARKPIFALGRPRRIPVR